MGKRKKHMKRKNTLYELQESRNGGQIALTGFTYQFLYSCYLILSTYDANTFFYLEGIEDIDKITIENEFNNTTHIQLKYSTKKQDASFLKEVLKNYLEAYLINKERKFKLIYDFDVAQGHLSKLFYDQLDSSTHNYWQNIINKIKEENSDWNWVDFSYDDFIDTLSFERKEKSILCDEIEKLLIKNYEIMTNNISIFANGLKVFCLEKMEQRGKINRNELDRLITEIKDDISKGSQNPAHRWIRKVAFEISDNQNKDYSYYEGKKPSYDDISMGLPVNRETLENKIESSITENRVTVIKASSGQGKTTLAMKTAYNMRDQYNIYQLLWCNDRKELPNIALYFDMRVKMGEKPLIIIDNLDSQLSEWNALAQLLQEKVSYNYKLIVTTREEDWYNYSGDVSNIKSLQVIKLSLEEKEAHDIYEILRKTGKLHSSITEWKKSYRKIEKNKLLIEYIYLLTHGEMLSERINSQIIKLNSTDSGRLKCEILRKICFADICGIKLSVNKLISSLTEKTSQDYGEILKSMENEFFIRIDGTQKYVEGLHPVRSQHITDKLHEFIEVENTALQVVSIADFVYHAKLFSCFPRLIRNKESFYLKLTEILWDKNNLSCYIDALRGIFSGSVMQYYFENKQIYDDANEHGGLFLVDMELNPFTRFTEIGETVKTLNQMQEMSPENENIMHLINLRNNANKIELPETDIYRLSSAIYERLKSDEMFEITSDIISYSKIAYWLIKIDYQFNLSNEISLDLLWNNCDGYPIEAIADIMYVCFYGNKSIYTEFVKMNLDDILIYLRNKTESLEIYVNEKNNEIHVNYLLLPSEIYKGNDESVSRLKIICKMLPIFNNYCADAIKPVIDLLSGYEIPDDAHKTIPIRNLVIMFHQEFTSIWSKTVFSNYECDSIFEWLGHWFLIRTDIMSLFSKIILCIHKILEKRVLGQLAGEIDYLRTEIEKKLIMEYRYPYEDRPFDEKVSIPEGLSKIKCDFFQSILNFNNQLVGFLNNDEENTRLALINLRKAISVFDKMQEYFTDMHMEHKILIKENQDLCLNEEKIYQEIMDACLYFKEYEPNKYFNKYQIKVWNEKRRKDRLEKATEVFSELLSMYSVNLPKQEYFEDILSYYPIVIKNLDITNETELLKVLYLCTSFYELGYDYLVLLICDDNNRLMPNGLKLSKNFLETLKQIVENEGSSLTTELSSPFPVEVTLQMINSFESKYYVKKVSSMWYDNWERVGELLWALSKSRQLLTKELDKKYLTILENKYMDGIRDILSEIKPKIPNGKYEEIETLCKKVFEGDIFLDREVNKFYNYQEEIFKVVSI